MRKTYCNPLNLDYAYVPFPDMEPHRATADPLVVVFKGASYLFATNQKGYWYSHDRAEWTFIERSFLTPLNHTYDDLCAPSAFVLRDELYVIGSTYTEDFTLWKSSDPLNNKWEVAKDRFTYGGWDPAHLVDDDGRLYLYHGSSNTLPLYGIELDSHTFEPIGEKQILIDLDDHEHGWERFGEHHDNVFLRPFIEGAWMNKVNGKYYLQYGGPGTEFSGYADGVYVGDAPLGPFTYQPHNPFCSKSGGYARGSGHGGTWQADDGRYWHTSTISISVKNNFERRVGIWPCEFDQDGLMWCDTTWGDYPSYVDNGSFTGWMLLNYNKPVQVSSTLGGFAPNFLVDECIRTYWSASGTEGEWAMSDLGEPSTVHAIQINFADQDATLRGRQPGLRHRHRIFASDNANEWSLILDKSTSTADTPHDYVELTKPVNARFIKIECLEVPTGKFALSGLRVFGHQDKPSPGPVSKFIVLRGDSERRNAWCKWSAEAGATGYILHIGIAPDKLYTTVMVYGATETYFRMMDRSRGYWFAIQAFNEGGVGPMSEPVESA